MSISLEYNLDALTDEELVQHAQDGCTRAFETLSVRHSPRLTALAVRMLRSPTEAQDVVQDALLSAWRKLERFRGDASFGSWVYRIATNACLMRLRTRRRRPEVPLELGEGSLERPVIDPRRAVLDRHLDAELGAAIEAAMLTLPPNYRAVFVLADLEDRSMREIAELLDLSVPNVKTRLHRARLRLRSKLAPYLAAEPALRVATGENP